MLKHNWTEVRDRYRAFWRGEKLDRSPVIFDTIGAWRHPMYNGAGYDYTKYGEDIPAFCRDFRAVWEARAAGGDRHSCGPGTGSWRLPASGQRRLSGAPRAGAQPGRFDGQGVK